MTEQEIQKLAFDIHQRKKKEKRKKLLRRAGIITGVGVGALASYGAYRLGNKKGEEAAYNKAASENQETINKYRRHIQKLKSDHENELEQLTTKLKASRAILKTQKEQLETLKNQAHDNTKKSNSKERQDVQKQLGSKLRASRKIIQQQEEKIRELEELQKNSRRKSLLSKRQTNTNNSSKNPTEPTRSVSKDTQKKDRQNVKHKPQQNPSLKKTLTNAAGKMVVNNAKKEGKKAINAFVNSVGGGIDRALNKVTGHGDKKSPTVNIFNSAVDTLNNVYDAYFEGYIDEDEKDAFIEAINEAESYEEILGYDIILENYI